MSVLVKGMRMPECCAKCPLVQYEEETWTTWCNITDIKVEEWNKPLFNGKHESCPLVEVPEPHGRLIPANAVIEKAYHEAEAMEEPYKDQFGVLVEWIVDKTSSVIEAEDE